MKGSCIIVLATMLIAGCGTKNKPRGIVGIWKETTNTYSECDVPAENKTEPCSSSCTTLGIKEDGTFTYFFQSISENGTFTATDSTITFTLSGRKPTFPFVLTDSILVFWGMNVIMDSSETEPEDTHYCQMATTMRREER